MIAFEFGTTLVMNDVELHEMSQDKSPGEANSAISFHNLFRGKRIQKQTSAGKPVVHLRWLHCKDGPVAKVRTI